MNKGMTLLEVMISMLILGLAAASIYATFAVVGKGPQKSSATDLQAMNYARETLEKLKNAVSTNSTRSTLLDAGTNKSDAVAGGVFTRTYDVVDIDANDDGIVDYKKVTVTVKW
ncbi:MAG: prepilin-type N-terminal cleavage/methylation domain-containing protein [Candidatus Omnitrophica bacterium]|nr:prepilin-type N-terminal cleavage/methylation domain-containing protein [Candidatus Omnitrophota bacterium]